MSPFASPAARVTLVMSCLFTTTGVTLVFLPRWLEVERALSGAEIGLVLSLAQFARILTGPAIAFWADGAADRRLPLRLVSGAALAAFAAFFFLAHDFWSLLLLGFIALSLLQAVTPLIEAALLRATAQGRISYGLGRGIGSVAFIVANIVGGFMVARFGIGAVVVWVLLALASLLASSVFALTPDPPAAKAPSRERFGALAALMRSRRFVIVLVSCGLIQCAHAFYYAFSTIAWRAQGVPAETIGLLWAFGVAVEVALLWSLAPIERRVSAEAMILVAAAGAVMRWIAMGFAPEGAILWFLQALHALSFAAAHVGAMRLIYREAPDNAAAMAQTLYSSLSSGLLLGIATIASGWLYDWGGAKGYWAMAALAGAGGLIALMLFTRRAATSR
ncbi:MAG TPA: MFS transporter [Terricaulis sp.]|nr:MFS transporter [Terricaulis sp.]